MPIVSDVDQLLAGEVLTACRYACSLAESDGGIPVLRVRSLSRAAAGTVEVEREVVDWRFTFPALTREPGFWDRLVAIVASLCTDRLIDELTGWMAGDARYHAQAVWTDVPQPLIQRYRETLGSWDQDSDLIARLIAQRRAAYHAQVVPMQTLIPMHNLAGPAEPVEIEPGLSLRPITDQERAEFWESFAGSPSSAGLTINQLAGWTHALDIRWEMPRRMPIDYSPVDDQIDDVVRPLQLLYPSAVGYSLTWSRADPPDYPSSRPWTDQRLTAPRGLPAFTPIRCALEPFPLEDIRRLLAAMRGRGNNKGLEIALRRFDLASGRASTEDSLIDLWITLEALLVSDGTAELRYRASLRLARLCGDSPQERQEIFAFSKKSYDARSKIVHGENPPKTMPRVISRTRGLAQQALRRWLLDRPTNGIETLDEDLLS
jgi:hypothetical protein